MTDRRTQGDDLTGRRKGYTALKNEIHHFFREVWVVVVVIGVLCTVALIGYGLYLRELDQATTALCKNLNVRHDNAIYTLIKESNQDQLDAKTEHDEEEIRWHRDLTANLINAFAPNTDCADPQIVKPLPAVTPIPEKEVP